MTAQTTTKDLAIDFDSTTFDVGDHVRFWDTLSELQREAESRKLTMPAQAVPQSIDHAGLVNWWHMDGESSSVAVPASEARRFDVDPEAMSELVDWAINHDLAPDGDFRRDAWH
jgi:hypothetical protein